MREVESRKRRKKHVFPHLSLSRKCGCRNGRHTAPKVEEMQHWLDDSVGVSVRQGVHKVKAVLALYSCAWVGCVYCAVCQPSRIA